jgi:hypothetical protein
MSVKNSSDTTGNRTSDLPACSAWPQLTALPRGPLYEVKNESYPWWIMKFQWEKQNTITEFLQGNHGKLSFSEDILKVTLIDNLYAFGIL